MLDAATPERYVRAVELAAGDPNADGLLAILTPQPSAEPTRTAELMQQRMAGCSKPVLAAWMGGVEVGAGGAALTRAGIPTFEDPDTAARVFTLMWRHSYVLRGLYQTPSLAVDADGATPRERVEAMVQAVRGAGRTLMTEVESKQVLAAYGIPVVETRVATAEDEAVACARDIGFPVVLKLLSESITHKTEVGGVQLNLQDDASVRQAYQRIRAAVAEKAGAGHMRGVTVQPMIALDGFELIVGSLVDPQFGPVVMFGSGGHLLDSMSTARSRSRRSTRRSRGG